MYNLSLAGARRRMTELTWDGKYKDGKKGPVRIALPFQTIETVNESAQRPPLAARFPASLPLVVATNH